MRARLWFVFAILFLSHGYLLSQDLTRDLKLVQPRMNGEDVAKLQTQLLQLGFSEVGTADGWFGPKTQLSVKGIQKYLGFKQSGIVDKELWNALFAPDKDVLQIEKDVGVLNQLTLDKYSKTTKDLLVQSTEGGGLTEYRDKGATKYIQVGIYGETGKVEYEVYPVEDRYLVVEANYKYPAPFDVEHATIAYSVYYYRANTTVEVKDGKLNRTNYDSIGILKMINGTPTS